jgi:hypothetical protein
MRFPSKREIGTLAVAGTLSGCSFIYDLSPDQCGSSSDCAKFGEFYACEEGMCVQVEPPGECDTNANCLDEDPNTPRACIELEPGRTSSRTCVELTSPDCPRMLPTGDGANGELWRQKLRLPGSIVIGAFGFLPAAGYSKFTRNYDLALTELENFAGGVVGRNGTTRPIVAVVCNNTYMGDQAPLLENVRHLVDDVRVPAIISSMNSAELQDAFSQTQQSEVNPDVLFVSPNSSTEGVADLQDNNLVWNILTNGEQVAIPYASLLTRTIDYLRAEREIPAGEIIKVAVVFANDQRLLIDIKAALRDLLHFNEMDYDANLSEGYLAEIQVTSSYEDEFAPLTDQIDRILEFAPHVIIEVGANELFSTLIPGPGGSGTGIEDRWEMEVGPDQPRPFYLLSPYHYLVADDLPLVISRYAAPDPISLRMAGVNYAAAPEEFRYVTDAWLGAYANMFPDDPGTPTVDESDTTGYENYYDAPWYVFGAIAATTGRTDAFTGLDLAQGMLRLQNPNGTEYTVGGADIQDVVDDLADGDSIEYIGTMGLPTFDSSGARTGSGSVWCVTASSQQLADVLRVDPGSDPESAADDVLVGDGFMSCNPDF